MATTLSMASGAEARSFKVVGASATARAVEDAVLAPIVDGAQPDQIHAEFSVKYRQVREPGLFKSPVLQVPGTTRILIKGVTKARGNGQTWVRDHYATWSCTLKPHRFKTVRDYTTTGGTVQSQVGESFNFDLSEKYCKASEQGALPGGIGTTGGKRLAPEMLISHAFTASELKKRRKTIRLTQVASGALDCRTVETVSCTDTASASGKLKLRRRR
jgi:hypothetical protein